MNAWKHQEEVKEKKELKAALVLYRNALVHMPMRMGGNDEDREKLSLELNDLANKIYLPLVVLEEDLDEGILGKKIFKFLSLHYDYLQQKATRQDVAHYLSELLAMKIIELKK